jgi:hypothetical protein
LNVLHVRARRPPIDHHQQQHHFVSIWGDPQPHSKERGSIDVKKKKMKGGQRVLLEMHDLLSGVAVVLLLGALALGALPSFWFLARLHAGRPASHQALLTGPLSLPLQLYQPKEERSLCCAELCCVLWPRPLVSYLYTVMGRSEATPPDSRPASRRMLDTAILRRADPFPLSCKSLSAPARRQLHFFTDSPLVVYGMFLAILSSGS